MSTGDAATVTAFARSMGLTVTPWQERLLTQVFASPDARLTLHGPYRNGRGAWLADHRAACNQPPQPPPPQVDEEAIGLLEGDTRLFRLPHLWHRDRNWQADGIHAYHQCRCGARRVQWINPLMHGPARPGWPELRDRHGMPVADTGWRKPRAGGWPA